MLTPIPRRDFLRFSSILTVGTFLTAHSKALAAKAYSRGSSLKGPFLPANFNYEIYEDYIAGETLIQAYDYTLNSSNTANVPGTKLTVLCNVLTIDGLVRLPKGILNVFCNELKIVNAGCLDVSGVDSAAKAGQKLGKPTADHPDGPDADNIDPSGNAIQLDGGDAGSIMLVVNKINPGQGATNLQLKANGGNGAPGQQGGDGVNGKDGQFLVNIDGLPPGRNGTGAPGGSGGNAGRIWVRCSPVDGASFPDTLFAIESKSGKGAPGGIGGTAASHGGKGLIAPKPLPGVPNQRSFPDGHDYSTTIAPHGAQGPAGPDGGDGFTKKLTSYFSYAPWLPSSFIRLQMLKGEFFYINNQFDDAAAIFAWVLALGKAAKEAQTTTTNVVGITNYAQPEPLDFWEEINLRCNTYLNQLKLHADFFGNPTNYTTLLDEAFIGDRIASLKPFFDSFENLTADILQKDLSYQMVSTKLTAQIDANKDAITQLKDKISKANKDIFDLNDEIISRYNSMTTMTAAIIVKEGAFRQAVEAANSGCSLASALNAISMVVTVVSGVGGLVGAGQALLQMGDDAAKLKNNFIDKVDTIGPWVSPDKWKQVFTTGGNQSLVSQINSVKADASKFSDNAKTVQTAYAAIKGDNQQLISFPDNPTGGSGMTKQQFADQMKDFVDKYPEAKDYENEVFKYMDYCDATNNKRVEFTNCFLGILRDTYQIDRLNKDIDHFQASLNKAQTEKVDSSVKIRILDAYYQSLHFLLQLVYLQQKALDYFTLENSTFSAPLYNVGITGLYATVLDKNGKRLTDYLEAQATGRGTGRTLNPIKITQQSFPLQFGIFRSGTINPTTGKKIHTLNFAIIPIDDLYLEQAGDVAELYIISAQFWLPGCKTTGKEISYSIKHLGNSTFIRSDKQKITFSHKPVKKTLSYKLDAPGSDNMFTNIAGDYKINNVNPYVGVSPFANWCLEIDENNDLNSGLDLTGVTTLEVSLTFYENSFKS